MDRESQIAINQDGIKSSPLDGLTRINETQGRGFL